MLLELFLADARIESPAILFAGAIGLLVSVLAMTRSLVAGNEMSPGRHALAHWLPIAATALVAAGLGHAEMGIGVLLGTSVGALSTVLGFVTLAGPLEEVPERARRAWLFLPVPAMLVFMMGFQGTMGPWEAGAFAVQGLLLLLIWSDPSKAQEAPGPAPAATVSEPHRKSAAWVAGEVAVILALAAVAAWAATLGAQRLQEQDARYPTSVVAATLLSAVLILPMVSTGVPLAMSGKAWAPLMAQVGVVFLNLGALLPAVIVVRGVVGPLLWRTQLASTSPADPLWEPILYPRICWRIDAVALLILSLLFVPVAAGKLKFDRRIAVWLIIGYCVYLLSVLALGAR